MQIVFPAQCMTVGQENSGDEQMTTAKYDTDFCFLPASSAYWRSYMVGLIQTG